MIGLAMFVTGVVVVVIGYALSGGSLYQKCGECNNPMPDGWESNHDGIRRCRSCTNRLGLKPWYWKKVK